MSRWQHVPSEELAAELTRRRCEATGHPPGEVMMVGDRAVSAYCECGEVTWVKKEKKS